MSLNANSEKLHEEILVIATTQLVWLKFGKQAMELLEERDGPLSDREKEVFEKAFGAGVITVIANAPSVEEVSL